MRLSSSSVARSAIAILSTVLLCGLSGTAVSQTATGSATQLPGITVVSPRQVARPQGPQEVARPPQRPTQVANTVASRPTSPTTQTPPPAKGSMMASLPRLRKPPAIALMVAKRASSPATPPGLDVTRLVEFFHRRAETCATSKPMRSALKTDCCLATDPVNNGRTAPVSPPGRSFRSLNSSDQDVGNSPTACGLSASPLWFISGPQRAQSRCLVYLD
jgi:hypothetical protein